MKKQVINHKHKLLFLVKISQVQHFYLLTTIMMTPIFGFENSIIFKKKSKNIKKSNKEMVQKCNPLSEHSQIPI